jgi:hypothetical protein
MTHHITSIGTIASRRNSFYKIGVVAGLISGMLLLVGMISLIASVLQPNITNSWLSLFQNNWLVKIFILHAGFSRIHADLQGLNLLDLVILFLVSIICLSLSTVYRKASKVWSLMAFALSVIAIVLFLITQIAGRSTVMLAILINSFVMLKDKIFYRTIIYTGIVAGIFLFVGDLTVGVHSNIITTLFGIGYMLLIAWFFLLS